MLEQLRALWNSREREKPLIKGILLTRNGPADPCCNVSNAQISERWFALVGHTLFSCKQSESPDYSAVFLTDVFSPVIARVSQKILDAFELPEVDQVCMGQFLLGADEQFVSGVHSTVEY